MTEAVEYIRIVGDPFTQHSCRGWSTHNKWSLNNRVFKVKYPQPVEEEIVSIMDGTYGKQMCYIIDRDEFLRVCPYFEGVRTKTFAIPVEFAVPWKPEGRINPETGKPWGLEYDIEVSKLIAKQFGLNDILSRR